MATKKPSLDLTGLVATKGDAQPSAGIAQRGAAEEPPVAPKKRKAGESTGGAGEPLFLRVPADVKREFRRYAFEHDLTLGELLQRAFEAYTRSNN